MDRIYQTSVTVPFATAQTAPLTQNVTLENAILVAIELLIPPGHGGFTGIRIRQSRQQILPWDTVNWIIANDYTNKFPVNTEIGSKAISVQAYNEDVYPHTFYLRWHLQTLGSGETSAFAQAANNLVGLISSTGDDLGVPIGSPSLPGVPSVPALPPPGGAPPPPPLP